MSDSSNNHSKIYVDHPKDVFKSTHLIHGPRHSPDECKVLGEFGSKYAKNRPTKDIGQDPENRKKMNGH